MVNSCQQYVHIIIYLIYIRIYVDNCSPPIKLLTTCIYINSGKGGHVCHLGVFLTQLVHRASPVTPPKIWTDAMRSAMGNRMGIQRKYQVEREFFGCVKIATSCTTKNGSLQKMPCWYK